MSKLTYQQFAIVTFTNLQHQPKPEIFLDEKVIMLQASYLSLINGVVILCTPPQVIDQKTKLVKIDPKKLSAKEFSDLYPRYADRLMECVTYIVDSSKYAIASCDPEAPTYNLYKRKTLKLTDTWNIESSSLTLKKIFDKHQKAMIKLCPLNHRLITALSRLKLALIIADGLIKEFKGTNPQPYIKGLVGR